MHEPTERLAEKSLSQEKPWDLNEYPKSFPPGWEWNAKSGRWNQPPKNWRFNGRYWVQMPTCSYILTENANIVKNAGSITPSFRG